MARVSGRRVSEVVPEASVVFHLVGGCVESSVGSKSGE